MKHLLQIPLIIFFMFNTVITLAQTTTATQQPTTRQNPKLRPPGNIQANLPTEKKLPETETLAKSKWDEAHAIIDDIKVQNPPRTYRLKGRTGLIQLISNTPDAVTVGQGGNVTGIGIDAVGNFWGNLGIEARVLYAQNLLPNPSSVNTGSASTYWVDLGPRYTFYLDNTRLDNNFAVKILYHQNTSNFKIADPSNGIYMTHYAGFSGSIERSIPITKKLGVLASFDLLQIFQARSPSTLGFKQSGYGFEVQGEIYYQIELWDIPFRMGFSYWQQGNDNEFDDSAKSFTGRNSYFQLARALFVNLTTLF